MALDRFHQSRKHFVTGTFDDHQNAVSMLLLELLGIGIQTEARFFRSPQDDFPGSFADIGLVVENTGDGAYRVTGLRCKIFDRQRDPLQSEFGAKNIKAGQGPALREGR